MPILHLPSDVETVLRETRTCEFTTVNKHGQPLTWPIEPYYNKPEGQLIVTSSIAFSVKAYNARRHPQVSLLFSDPIGSGLSNPSAVLVQGDARVEELVTDPLWTYEIFREAVLRQPNMRKFVSNFIVQRLFQFHFQRIAIYVQPKRLFVWPNLDFKANAIEIEANGAAGGDNEPKKQVSREPSQAVTQESAWNASLVEAARAYASGVLTVVEPSAYPFSIRCQVAFDDAQHFITFASRLSLAEGWRGKACLLFHRHDEYLGDKYEMLIKGELTEMEGKLVMRPSSFLTASGSATSDHMPVSGSMRERMQFMLLGQRKAREYLAKRGQPWPPTPWKKMLRYLDEGPASLESK